MSHTDRRVATESAGRTTGDCPAVLITGAQHGLGFAMARRMSYLGWRVYAGVLEESGEIASLRETCGGRIDPVILDVTRQVSIQSAFETVSGHGENIDIIINNAGIHPDSRDEPFESVDFFDGHLEAEMQVNAFGIVRVTQAFLPLVGEAGWKRIINITSEAGSIGACRRKREFGYSMSKSAANMATMLLQNALSDRDITVRALHPGWVRTPMAGPDADLSPQEAAEAVCAIVLDRALPERPVYMDWRGEALPW